MIETPRYVTDGVNYLDDLISRHLYGVEEEQTKYGPRFYSNYLATSNSGWRHDLPGAPFTMKAFDWGDCVLEGETEYGGYCTLENCEACKPNFSYPASDLKLWWYKHSQRGEECNRNVDYEEWRNIMRECEDWILAQPKGSKKP